MRTIMVFISLSVSLKRHASTNTQLQAVLLLMTSALLFSTMGLLIRLASHHTDNLMVVFSRNLIGVLILGPIALIHFRKSGLQTRRPMLHLVRATTGLTAMYGFFYALAHMPLANAMVFTYSAPVFIPIIAWLFLNEHITLRIIISTLLGLIGVFLVCKPQAALWNIMTLVGIASAMLAASAFVCVRALTTTESPQRIVLYFSSIATLISAFPLLGHIHQEHLPKPTDTLILAGIGILATLSQLCLSKAYSLAPASRIGPINYLAIVLAGSYAWLLWGEKPNLSACCGFVLILLATYLCLGDQNHDPQA